MTSAAVSRLQLGITDDICSIEAEAWNRLARLDSYSPFLEHEFLSSVEQSGCASPETGWYPRHFLLFDSGRLIAAAPAYVKTHSMGEFVFDQGLAQAAMDMGRSYYPKLVATLPFTPSPGYRFLIDPDYDETAVTVLLINGMKDFRDEGELGSLSVLFTDPEWEDVLKNSSSESSPMLEWTHQYFLWKNEDFKGFDDYLARFRKNQRRNIRRERASILDAGIRISVLTGEELTEAIMDRMYQLYLTTNELFGPWAAFFLNRDWFREIGRCWANRILIFAAWLPGDSIPSAMSMVIKKNNLMVGRYWGTTEYIRNLHFELCYYAPIEYAIEENITEFDPGMGSPHKARRGFRSRGNRSFHDITDPELSALFNAALSEANRDENILIAELNESIPWGK